MQRLQEKIKDLTPELKKKLGVTNVMAIPRILKVVINSGTGRAKDKKRNELVADRISKIVGQKTSARGAKTSVASFKLREGEIIGFAVTLRGARMYDFLDKLINIAIPRTRDFKGLNEKGIDDVGNYSIGIKEHIIFPETADEEIKDVFGLSITIVTTAKSRKDAQIFFKEIGFPFKK